jgi:peptide/nickel transport system substrate-binding protein
VFDFVKTAIISISTFLASLVPQPAYIEGVVGQPVAFNPLVKSTNEIDETIESLIFSSLPELASSYEISEDGKDWTFHLPSDLKFHDGRPLTADDVVSTLLQLEEFKSLTLVALDKSTIQFRLEKPFAPFLELLDVGIVPPDFPADYAGLTPVGSGPHRVVAVKKSSRVDEIELAAVNPEYQIKRLVFKFYPTHQELKEAVKLGDVLAYGGPKILNWSTFNYWEKPLADRYYGLFFNLNGLEILRDRDFRRNLARALDKNVLLEQALGGEGVVVDSPIEGSSGESDDISIYEYQEVPSVTYNNKLTLTVPATMAHLKAADIIKDYWSLSGVAIDIRPVPPADILEKVIEPKDFEILLYGLEVGRDPDRYVYWHSTQTDYPGLNFTGYSQARVDKALEDGRRTMDDGKRREDYADFQRVLTADVPVIWLYRPLYTFGVSKKISVSLPETLFQPKDRFENIKEWHFE